VKFPLLKSLVTIPFLLSALVAETGKASWDISSNIDLTTRSFTEDARWSGQDDATTQLSIAGTTELRWRGDESRASIIPYLRYDETDDERSLADLREAYWAKEAEEYELLIGVNTVFWGVTESVHLVDIINQTDAVADIDGEDKLGQPMLNLTLIRDWGYLDLVVMPYFRDRTFAGRRGRLRGALVVDDSQTTYEAGAGRWNPDVALRWSNSIGDWDVGAYVFRGTSREPTLSLALDSASGLVLVPRYELITQLGTDIQYTTGAWLWKLEALFREGQRDLRRQEKNYAAFVGGFEYTFFGVFESEANLGALVAFSYEDRSDGLPGPFDRDLFLGGRFAFNDVQSSEILAGVVVDTELLSRSYRVEASRRVGDSWRATLEMQVFSNIDQKDVLAVFESDDFLLVEMAYFF